MNARSFTRLCGVALAASSLGGCYTGAVRSGLPVGKAPVEYDERWHGGFLWGLVEGSGPYDLNRICPQGWAEVRTETSFAAGLLDVITIGIYSPQNITIVCAAPMGMAPLAAPLPPVYGAPPPAAPPPMAPASPPPAAAPPSGPNVPYYAP